MVDKRQSARIFVGTKENNLTHQKTKKMNTTEQAKYSENIYLRQYEQPVRNQLLSMCRETGLRTSVVDEALKVYFNDVGPDEYSRICIRFLVEHCEEHG